MSRIVGEGWRADLDTRLSSAGIGGLSLLIAFGGIETGVSVGLCLLESGWVGVKAETGRWQELPNLRNQILRNE